MGKGSAFTLAPPDCAGIDLGSTEHYVAVPSGRSEPEVRVFGCFAADLVQMGDWLLSLAILDVAMEATGVYWMPVYEALASRGLKVALVDGRAAKALPGRKSDVSDCQWIRDLHMHGLLRPCAVLAGERDPKVLSSLLAARAKAKAELVEKALEGSWSSHHLFALEEAMATYDFLGERLSVLDARLDEEMAKLRTGEPGGPSSGRKSKNDPDFDLRARIVDALGVDPTTTDEIQAMTAATLLAEFGTDLSRFKSEKHFVSHLGLAPVNKITQEDFLRSCLTMIRGTEGHGAYAEAFVKRTVSIPFGAKYQEVIYLIPATPCRMLDIGAGCGLMRRGSPL